MNVFFDAIRMQHNKREQKKTICIQNYGTNLSLPQVLLYLVPHTRSEMVQSHLHSQQGLGRYDHDGGYGL